MIMDEQSFHQQADALIERLVDRLDDAIGDKADVELQSEIATIVLADGKSFVINKNAHNREIWLASPISGGWHFAWDATAQAWLSTRSSSVEFIELLGNEIEQTTGSRVSLTA